MRSALIATLILCTSYTANAQGLMPWLDGPTAAQRLMLSDTYIANLKMGCETADEAVREKCNQLVGQVNELMQSVRQQLVYNALHEDEPDAAVRGVKFNDSAKELRGVQAELFKQFPGLTLFATTRPVSAT